MFSGLESPLHLHPGSFILQLIDWLSLLPLSSNLTLGFIRFLVPRPQSQQLCFVGSSATLSFLSRVSAFYISRPLTDFRFRFLDFRVRFSHICSIFVPPPNKGESPQYNDGYPTTTTPDYSGANVYHLPTRTLVTSKRSPLAVFKNNSVPIKSPRRVQSHDCLATTFCNRIVPSFVPYRRDGFR